MSVINKSIVPSCVLTACNSMTVCNAIHFADVNYLGVLVADNPAFSSYSRIVIHYFSFVVTACLHIIIIVCAISKWYVLYLCMKKQYKEHFFVGRNNSYVLKR